MANSLILLKYSHVRILLAPLPFSSSLHCVIEKGCSCKKVFEVFGFSGYRCKTYGPPTTVCTSNNQRVAFWKLTLDMAQNTHVTQTFGKQVRCYTPRALVIGPDLSGHNKGAG